MSLPRPCLDCGQGTTRGARCGRCSREQERQRGRQRGNSHQRGYTRDWRKLVQDALDEQPWCSWPGCMATEDLTGDHVVPLSKGGTNTAGNVRILCRTHNSRRQAGGREQMP